MAPVAIQGGTYDDRRHEYRDERGDWIPSITQIISLCGFTKYDGISPEVLEAAAQRGSTIHAICWSLAKFGDYDQSWSNETIEPYVAAYKKAVHELGFVIDTNWVETPIIANTHGMKFAVTPDCIGHREPWPMIVELKTTASESPSWAIQTMAQAIARFGIRADGAKRMALMLRKNGTYRCCVHENNAHDKSVFLAALTCVWWRLRNGHKLWERN